MMWSAASATEVFSRRSRYTGKERDIESGNDYFGARYYSSAMGRFLSPDWSAKEEPVPYAKLDDPQTLNLYSYVGNNPLSRTDADGHCFEDLCIGETIAVVALWHATVATAVWLNSPSGRAAVNRAVQTTNQVIDKVSNALHSSTNDSTKPPPAASSDTPKDVYIDPNKYPAAAGHADDAQKGGQPDVLTVTRPGSDGRRDAATAGTATQAGMDRDEYPPAVTAEGGKGASVRSIPSGDNRGAGASVGRQIRDVPDGGKIRIIPKPKPQGQSQ